MRHRHGVAPRVAWRARTYTLGVLVQANYGMRDTLRIAGVPVGQHLRNDRIYSESDPAASDTGSIIIVVGTDAPLLPHQLKRIARRPALGLGRMGSFAGNGSGDIFIAFSTANAGALKGAPLTQSTSLGNDQLDPLFNATVQATEEAIVNAMVAARDMQGNDGHYAKALPHAELVRLLEQYGRRGQGCSASLRALRSRPTASSTSASLTDSGGMKRTVLVPQESRIRPLW